MPYVYAIIREDDNLHLRLIKKNISKPQNISNNVLAKYFNYAISLSEAYCSCLPQTTPNKIGLMKKHRMDAFAMETTIKKIQSEHNVVAISHRYGGFTHFDWDFGENITIHIYTNFGYGNASDFTSTFKYKDIILAPYSYYVKYKNSTFASVVRCTNSYYLDYDEWYKVMTDCLAFYNAIIRGNETYIFNWLNNHLSTMITGLERFITLNCYNFYDAYENNHVSKMAFVSGDDFWIIKAKKIARSIEFIENIKVLPVEIDTKNYINRLLTLWNSFLPKLEEKIIKTKKLLNEEKSYLQVLKESGDYPLYNKLYNKYYWKKSWYQPENNLKMIWFLMHLLKRINPQYNVKEIRTHFSPLNSLIEKVNAQTNKVSNITFLYESLKEEFEFMQNQMEEGFCHYR